MKLYLVEYCNGQPYEDYWRTPIGVYSTMEKADEAGKISVAMFKEPAEDEGYYEVKVVELDVMHCEGYL